MGQPTTPPAGDLICVFVRLHTDGADRFYVLRWPELQRVLINGYRGYLERWCSPEPLPHSRFPRCSSPESPGYRSSPCVRSRPSLAWRACQRAVCGARTPPRPHRSAPAGALCSPPARSPRHAHRLRKVHPAGAGPTLVRPRRGNRHTRPAPRATHDRDVAHPPGGVRGGRQQRGRVLDCLRRQPRADSLGGRLREALWRVSHPRLVREDHWAAPPLPGRSPPGQRRPLSVGHRPHAVPPANGRLRCATYGRRPHQT